MKPLAKILLILSVCFSHHADAQKEANIWYFGRYSALDFNNGTPVPLSGSAMGTAGWSGSMSIADKNGNLQFYANASRVWNSNNVEMPNGVLGFGNPPAIQPGIIVPAPSDSNIYYLFTMKSLFSNQLNYSIIDMTLDGGSGDIDVNTKNIPLIDSLWGKVTAIPHANGHDIWVITHKDSSNIFYSFLVSDTGVSTIPSISSAGPMPTTNGVYGQMKASPNGKRIAFVTHTQSRVEMFDFNNSTGTVSNPLTWTTQNWSTPLGIEFSPNGNILYTASQTTRISQYNLLAGDGAAITASAVGLHLNNQYGSMQLGPDGKIYVARWDNDSTIGAINFPDSLGLSCNYDHYAVPLQHGASDFGLPNLIPAFFAQPINYENNCLGDTALFWPGGYGIDSISWDFGDPNSGLLNYSSLTNPYHIFLDTGLYTITAVFWTNNQVDTHTTNIYIHPLPQITLGADSIICPGDSIDVVSNSTLQMTYLWQDSSTLSTYNVYQAGAYWLEATNMCGVASDTIKIDSVIPSQVNLGPDTVICSSTPLTLNATIAIGSYLWNDSTTNPTLDVDSSGNYWVITSNICQTDTNSITVQAMHQPIFPFPSDTLLCYDTSFTIWMDPMLTNYLWQDSSISNSHTTADPGIYWVEATNVCGSFSDTFTVFHDSLLTIDLGDDTTICLGESYILDPETPRTLHYWQNGSQDSFMIIDQPGVYHLQGINSCGYFRDTVAVVYESSPSIDLGQDSILCEGQNVLLDATYSLASYSWNNNDTNATIITNSTGQWMVTVSNLCGVFIDSINLVFESPLQVNLGADIDSCLGDTIKIAPNLPSTASYLWSNGSTAPSIHIFKDGTYAITVTNTCGNVSDKIEAYFLPQPEVELNSSLVLCEGEQVELSINSNQHVSNYLWSNGENNATTVVTSPGTYILKVSNKCGETTDQVNVANQPLPIVDLGVDTEVCDDLYSYVLLTPADTNLTFLWSTGDKQPQLLISQPGVYSVIVSDSFGCKNSDKIEISGCPVTLYIPEAFTPNGDGINDEFKAAGEDLEFFKMLIFDRWGQLIFETHAITEGWNGTFRSEKSPAGIYTYNIEYKGAKSLAKDLRGKVTLIR